MLWSPHKTTRKAEGSVTRRIMSWSVMGVFIARHEYVFVQIEEHNKTKPMRSNAPTTMAANGKVRLMCT